MTAICVDDEPLVLQLTVSLCKELPGLDDAVGFTRAEEALAYLSGHEAAVAILDIDMPDMNGLALAAKIKENPSYSFFEEETNNYVPTPHACPVCGKYKFEDECCFDICPFCGWEDDGTDDDTDILGANDLRFSLYKERYSRYLSQDPKYRWDKNGKP